MSAHETGTVTQQTTGAVSKHETVIPMGTSNLKSFKLRFRKYTSLLCALGGGRSVPDSARLCNSSANMEFYGANIAAGLSGQKFERSKVCLREYISLLCALGGGRSFPESARLSNTQHRGACSRGGVWGGGYPPPARLLCPSTRQVL